MLLWMGFNAIAQSAFECIEHRDALRPASSSCAWFAVAVMSRAVPVADLAAKSPQCASLEQIV
jgi:hypothetical protein